MLAMGEVTGWPLAAVWMVLIACAAVVIIFFMKYTIESDRDNWKYGNHNKPSEGIEDD